MSKINLRAAMFEPKNHIETRREEKPKPKKISGQERLNKMINDQKRQNEESKNRIQTQKHQFNFTNNTVKNRINLLIKKDRIKAEANPG